MAAPAHQKVTYEEYLAQEARSEDRHEYLDGFVRMMAGGSIEHARLAMRVARALGAALGSKPCEVFSSDAKVRIEASNRTTYADVTVVCGRLERSPRDAEAISNPLVLVEVLSEG